MEKSNFDSNSKYDLVSEAKKFTNNSFSIIPLKDKIAIIKYGHRRKQPATIKEIDSWFSNGKGKTPRANGIAIAINSTEFGIDTDGEKCESIFRNKLTSKLSPELQNKVNGTMQTKTPHGYHRTFRIIEDDFKDGIDGNTIVKFDGHNEITIIGRKHYFVERGPGYEIINDVNCIVTLSKNEVTELLNALRSFKAESNGIKTIVGVLKKHYIQPKRDIIAFTLSGFLHKNGVPEYLIHDTIEQLAIEAYDDEISSRLKVVEATCNKDPNSEQVSGYKALLEALDNDKTPINEIEQVFSQLVPEYKSQFEIEDEDEKGELNELRDVNDYILSQLSPFVCAVVSLNPPVMYVAHNRWRCIIKAFVKFVTETTTTKDGSTTTQQKNTRKQILQWKYKFVYAVPIKVVVNKNPLNGSKTYLVTFLDESSKKQFTIGPCSISSMLEELNSNGKLYKKAEAVDALTAVLNKYERLGIAEINESVTTQGYYYVKDKFETHDITQNIDKEPNPNDVLKCIDFLDELSTKWYNLDIFPTVVKWWTLAPFDSILKTVNRWLPNFHSHGWSSSAKTTLGKIGLATWRLHTSNLKKDFQLGFSNIDNSPRLGYVISNSTYPKLVNEVGALREKINRPLLEVIKQQVEAPFVRGKYLDGKYQNIPSLCKLFMTSNPRPPDDSGYRSKTAIIHHGKDDVHERHEKAAKEFEAWLASNLHLLGVLGDFIARYVIAIPEPKSSILFSTDKSYDNMACEIISAFYSSVGRDKPSWLDRIYEQRSIVEENTEQAYFEIRGFLMEEVTNAYSRNIMKIYNREEDTDSNLVIDFMTRLNFCLANKLIPYLHQYNRNKKRHGVEVKEIWISHDILTGLHRKLEHLEGITTMEDLVKELPGFEYTQRRIGGVNRRVLVGSREDFIRFLEGED